ncbi:MAG: hypothetical protein AB1305_05425, partial [Candidatus Hadarchaeota archaeon]
MVCGDKPVYKFPALFFSFLFVLAAAVPLASSVAYDPTLDNFPSENLPADNQLPAENLVPGDPPPTGI